MFGIPRSREGLSNIMSCRPPANSTYLVVGQDLFSVGEYMTSQYNYSLHRRWNSTNAANNGTSNAELGNVPSISSFVPSGENFP